MEGLLFAVYGLILFYPCVQFYREGYHPMLGLRWAVLFVSILIALPFLGRFYSFAFSGEALPSSSAIVYSQTFYWWLGILLSLTYLVSIVVQFKSGTHKGAKKDRWLVVEARVDAALGSGNIEGAISLYSEALRSSPRDFKGHFKFAKLLLRTGFVKRAYEHFLLSIDHCPDEYRNDISHEAVKNLDRSPGGEVYSDQLVHICRTRFNLMRDDI